MPRLAAPLIDVHHLGLNQTGNETWARCVAGALEADGGTPVGYAVTAVGRDLLPPNVDNGRISLVGGSSVRRLALDLPRAARNASASALLVQYTLPVVKTPGVVAVHDLSFEHPESKDWISPLSRARYRLTIKASVRRARRVLVPTEWTREDLLAHYTINPDRVLVAPLGLDPDLAVRLARTERSPSMTGLTVLCVGTVLPRKNLRAAAVAVRALRDEGSDVSLRLVGPASDQTELAALHAVLPEGLTVSGIVSPDVLAQAYKDADVLCYPSRFEGYGLPMIEAMAARLPVVASTATCLPEVAGNAALLVDPDDKDGLVAALRTALLNEPERARLRTAGTNRIAVHSWQQCAAVIRSALNQAAGDLVCATVRGTSRAR